MDKFKFNSDFPSDLESAKNTVVKALGFIQKSLPNLNDDEKGDLKLVLCELLFNAVIHGNNEDTNKRVMVSIEIEKNDIIAVISDEGKGFDFKSILAKNNEDDPIALFSENGRGIRLVMKLTDDVSFNKSGSQIVFHKRVNFYG